MADSKKSPDYTQAEREVIGLCISLEAVDNMANHALLELRDISKYPGEVEVRFHTSVHQELFIIHLLDFVREKGDRELTGVSGPCLKVLQSACDTRYFDRNGRVGLLAKSVEELHNYINFKMPIKLRLPTLDIEGTIKMSRLDLIFISGNHFKHNLSRLTRLCKNIHTTLDGQGHNVPSEEILLALNDFREHLQYNYFIYYATYLAELLNNIRWGLQAYLEPVFSRCCTKDNSDDLTSRYRYPKDIIHKVPRMWFWRLMNNIKTGPRLKQFSGAHYLKKQCSLESEGQ